MLRLGSRAEPGSDAGVTLVELLVVLALIGVLMGLGVGMYANLGKQGSFSSNLTRILSTINRVRNSSMTHPAALQIVSGDAGRGEENGIRGIEFVVMTQSQCEPLSEGDAAAEILPGAYGRDGKILGRAEFRDGVIGKALFLAGGSVDFGNQAAYDATEGVSISVWVWPETSRGGTLVQRGNGLGLSLVRRGEGVGIRFDLSFASGGGEAGGEPGDAKASSALRTGRTFEPKDVVLPLKKWSRIVATYDRSAVVIAVDTGRGPVEKLRERETAPLAPSTEESLYVGGAGGESSFSGGIDDLRIDGVLGEAYQSLPPTMEIEGPRRIYFLGGKLDPSRHTRVETIVLRMGRKERRIVIGTEGNILEK